MDAYPIQISESIWLTKQAAGLRPDGTQRMNVCVKSTDGVLVALESVTLHPDGTYSYKEKSLGVIGSEEFRKYLQKFQPAPAAVSGSPKIVPENGAELFDKVSATYKEIGSIKGVANLYCISEERARKILFTTGDYTCPTHEKIMAELRSGKTVEEAAVAVGLTRKKASAYLPYNK